LLFIVLIYSFFIKKKESFKNSYLIYNENNTIITTTEIEKKDFQSMVGKTFECALNKYKEKN